MSDENPERSEVMRSTIVTVLLTTIFLILAGLFWWWSSIEGTTPLTALNDINDFIVPILEVAFLFGSFVFLSITVINLKVHLTQIRAGWFELLLLLIIIVSIGYLMFGAGVAATSVATNLAWIGYLYLLQE